MQIKEIQNSSPIILIGLAIVFLILLSFIPAGLRIGPFLIKPVDIFMDVKPDSLLVQNFYMDTFTKLKDEIVCSRYFTVGDDYQEFRNYTQVKLKEDKQIFDSLPETTAIEPKFYRLQ